MVQEQHAAALDECPDTTGSDAAEPSRDAFCAVDHAQAGEDGGCIERNSARSRSVCAGGGGGDMSDLRSGMVVLGYSGLCGGVDLCLEPCLDNVQRASDYTSKAASCCAGEKLEGEADFAALLVLAGPSSELLPEHELQGREG